MKVWELPRLAADSFLDKYFAQLEALLESRLFDAVGHADTLLRAIPKDVFLRRVEPLIAPLVRSGIAYELNASGLRKSSLDPTTGKEIAGRWSYPSRALLEKLLRNNVPLTIGSDAHDPRDAGTGIAELMEALRPLGLQSISYYQQRQRIDVLLDDLQFHTVPVSR